MAHRASRFVLTILAAFAAFGMPAFAETEYEVKAAYTLRFVDYVNGGKPVGSPFTVGIVGVDPFDGAFQRLLSQNAALSKRAKIRYIGASDTAGLRACDVIFIANSERERVPTILRAVAGEPVLTVSDIEGFVEQGGMIGFHIQNSKVRFRTNANAADRNRIRIQAALVALGRK